MPSRLFASRSPAHAPLLVSALLLSVATGAAQTRTTPVTSTTGNTVVLSPFEIVAEGNQGYDATNTNSLTGVNASLQETPMDARIMTKQMLTELGGGDIFKLLGDFGGLGATLFGGGNQDQRVA